MASSFPTASKIYKKLGFKVKEGGLTKRRASEGYRSASAQERAQEFMALIDDPEVDGLISTIGGNNSSSLIPHLDFARIRESRKLVCGYSDVTSLHLAILKFSNLRTLYGPSVMCWFGEWPDGVPESTDWFLKAVAGMSGEQEVHPPDRWSNHMRNWANGDWQTIPRMWNKNEGWTILNSGRVEAPVLAVNFNTLITATGTPYWPDLEGIILLIEDMAAPLSRTERLLRQLQFTGAFDKIRGLIIGKPESFDQEGAPFGYDDLFREVIGSRVYPIVSNFDCGHTLPMISIPQLSRVRLDATLRRPTFTFLGEAHE